MYTHRPEIGDSFEFGGEITRYVSIGIVAADEDFHTITLPSIINPKSIKRAFVDVWVGRMWNSSGGDNSLDGNCNIEVDYGGTTETAIALTGGQLRIPLALAMGSGLRLIGNNDVSTTFRIAGEVDVTLKNAKAFANGLSLYDIQPTARIILY